MAVPTHRVYFGPTGNLVAEAELDEKQLAHADSLMAGNDGVLVVEGETIWYRIAGRSLHAIVQIPAPVSAAEKRTVRALFKTDVSGPHFIASDPDALVEEHELLETMTRVLGGYMATGLSVTEALDRITGRTWPFVLEIVNANA
jgi:hypothetical protein